MKLIEELNDLIALLYELDGCSSGGPLHIITEDGNIGDTDIVFCYRELRERGTRKKFSAAIAVIGSEILSRLIMLTEPQRLIWWHVGQANETLPKSIERILAARDGKIVRGDDCDGDMVVDVDGVELWRFGYAKA